MKYFVSSGSKNIWRFNIGGTIGVHFTWSFNLGFRFSIMVKYPTGISFESSFAIFFTDGWIHYHSKAELYDIAREKYEQEEYEKEMDCLYGEEAN